MKLKPNAISVKTSKGEFTAKGIYDPVKYFPYKNFGFPKSWDKEMLEKKTKEGYIFSGIRNGYEASFVNELDISQSSLWQCYEIVFDIPTPMPDELMNLKIENDKTINIKFESSKFIIK